MRGVEDRALGSQKDQGRFAEGPGKNASGGTGGTSGVRRAGQGLLRGGRRECNARF